MVAIPIALDYTVNPFPISNHQQTGVWYCLIHGLLGLLTNRCLILFVPHSFPGSAAGAAALKFGSAGSPRVRWQMRHERPRATRALRWGAPPTADPPTPGPKKHKKSFRRVGESFLAGIRVAHKRLQEHSPPPFWGYLKSEKSAVLTHFSDDLSLFESHKML